jgi:hypothetical protein
VYLHYQVVNIESSVNWQNDNFMSCYRCPRKRHHRIKSDPLHYSFTHCTFNHIIKELITTTLIEFTNLIQSLDKISVMIFVMTQVCAIGIKLPYKANVWWLQHTWIVAQNYKACWNITTFETKPCLHWCTQLSWPQTCIQTWAFANSTLSLPKTIGHVILQIEKPSMLGGS